MEIKKIKMNMYNIKGDVVGDIAVNREIFDCEVNEKVISRVVFWQKNKKMSGTHSTKNRSEVSGSGKKRTAQKGSGSARHSNRKTNIFVGGGVSHGPVARDHSTKLNKKERALGLKSVLSMGYKNDFIRVIDSLSVDSYKTSFWTKECSWYKALGDKSKMLIISGDEETDNLNRGTRNVSNCRMIKWGGLNVYDILSNKIILMSKDALINICKRLGCE